MASLLSSWWTRLAAGSGLTTLLQASRDAKLLCAQRFVRLFAYGASFLVLVPLLASLDIPDAQIGLFMTATLLGDVVISLLLTAVTDRVGRRRVLAAGAALMASSGVVFATSSHFWLLLLASIVGVISPSGNEIGPFRAVEESVLAQLTPADQRTDMFAWYTLFGTAGTALGALSSGGLVQLIQGSGVPSKATTTPAVPVPVPVPAPDQRDTAPRGGPNTAYRVIFVLYAGIGLVKLLLTLAMTPAVEAETAAQTESAAMEMAEEEDGLLKSDDEDDDDDDDDDDSGDDGQRRSTPAAPPAPPPAAPPVTPPATRGQQLLRWARSFFPTISPASRQILYRLVLLFALDSFASGLASPSWITYFFITVHAVAPAVLGTLFLVTNVLAALSNLLAVPLARRLGPLKTMVFTHLPSALFLALVPLPPASGRLGGTPLAMAFLALRACTQSMDQAPRQAFLAAAVLPGERTAVMGVVNTVKTLMQAGGVGCAGALAGWRLWVLLLSGAGALKASYDLLLLWSFVRLRRKQGDPAQRPGERRQEA